MITPSSTSVASPYPVSNGNGGAEPALPDRFEADAIESAVPASRARRIGLALLVTVSAVGAVGCTTGRGPAAPPATSTSTTVPSQRTALQKHVDYFDRNGDGQIPMSETYGGLRALKLGRARAALAATLINGTLGPSTTSHWWAPTTIDTANIHLSMHGSHTGIYDAHGQYVQARFDDMFARFDKDHDDAFSAEELTAMRAANETGSGAAASKAEFDMLQAVAGEDRVVDGVTVRVVTRERMQQLYDGSLFYNLAGEQAPE